jgi:hypothetical protein
MRVLCIVASITVVGVSTGCTRAAATSAASTALQTSVKSVASRGDTTITRFLQAKDAVLDTVLASQGRFVVAAVSRGGVPGLVTLIRDSAGVREIGPEINIKGLAYPSVRLVSADADEVLRVITFNDPVENIIGTAVDRIGSDGVHREFADPTAGCTAAVFAASHGSYTLRTYRYSPFERDCLSPCAEALRSATGTEPAEVNVLERIDDKWRNAAPDSNASISRGYAAVAGAIQEGRVPECAADSSRVLNAVARWRQSLPDGARE